MASISNGNPNDVAYSGALYSPATTVQTPWWMNGNSYVPQKNEAQQSYSMYNPGPNAPGAMNSPDGLAHAFNNLNVYSPGPTHMRPNNSAVPSAMPHTANGARMNNPTYYTLNDGRVFVAGNPGGQNGFQRGGAPYSMQHQPHYSGLAGPQHGNAPSQGNVHGAVWNGGQQSAEVPDLAVPRRTSLSSNEENGPQTPFFGAHATGFYPRIAVPDNSPQTWNTPSPQQLGQPFAAHQAQPLWRDSEQKQYIVKDLDAICAEDPAIPRPIPAIFSDDKARGTLETSLENKNHTTNVYVRGLHPNTTDEMLVAYGSRFGLISSAKSMIDQQTGLCKGFGFIKYHNYADGENCVRGFFHWGYEAKWARDSNNEKLKKLSDEENTNLYISNLPTEHDFNEHMLMAIFTDYECLSAKILRDMNGLSRGVGFARFASPEVCKTIIQHYNGKRVGEQALPISIRFADTPEQKRLKALTQERRQYKTHEYNVAAFGPGSPYSHLPPTLNPMSSPIPARTPIVNAGSQFPQYAYSYPYGATTGISPMALPASAPPALKASGIENTPLSNRSQVYDGLVNPINPQNKAEAKINKEDGVGIEPQTATAKVDHPVKLESLSVDNDAPALTKRNLNLPSPSKVKKDFAVKPSSSLGNDVENISANGSSTSSPIKNTPSKAPKASYARV